MVHERAGQKANASDLVDVSALIDSYFSLKPDATLAEQKVTFGTSGHRGSSFATSFNEDHILAITQAVVDYRNQQGFGGPVFVGRDTHALSEPAQQSVLEVLAGNGVIAKIDSADRYTPTPAVSVAIIDHNSLVSKDSGALADGIIITPSHKCIVFQAGDSCLP